MAVAKIGAGGCLLCELWWSSLPWGLNVWFALTRVRRRVCCAHQLLLFVLVAVEAFFTACAGRFISRLTREFLLASPQKKPKGLAPTLALRCASGALAPSLLQGSACRAIHGPTPFAAPAAQPLTQRLHSACDERGEQITSQSKIKSQITIKSGGAACFVGASLLANPANLDWECLSRLVFWTFTVSQDISIRFISNFMPNLRARRSPATGKNTPIPVPCAQILISYPYA